MARRFPSPSGTMDVQLTDDTMADIVLASPAPSFLKDASSRFVVCSQGLADYAELEPGEMIGKFDNDMPWANHSAHQFRDWDRRIMQTGETVLKIAETIRTASGDIRSIETNKFPIRDSHGRVAGVLGHFKEVRPPAVARTRRDAQPRPDAEEIAMRYLGGESATSIAMSTASSPSAIYSALRGRGLVDRWQSNPAEWNRYPAFLSAVRAFRLFLIRDELRLEAQQGVSSESSVDLKLAQKQVAALNVALAQADLPQVRRLVDAHHQDRVRELVALVAASGQSGGVVFGWQWSERYNPLVICRRYVAELERIDADRQAIDRELRGHGSS